MGGTARRKSGGKKTQETLGLQDKDEDKDEGKDEDEHEDEDKDNLQQAFFSSAPS